MIIILRMDWRGGRKEQEWQLGGYLVVQTKNNGALGQCNDSGNEMRRFQKEMEERA